MKIISVFKVLIVLLLAAAVFGSAGYFLNDIFLKPKKLERQEQLLPKPTPPPDPSLADFESSLKVKESGDLLQARTALEEFLQRHPKSTKAEDARDLLGAINIEIFFSPMPSPDKVEYVVQKGDALAKIERKMKAPRELIMRTNNLDDPRKLQIGQVLQVSRPEFSLSIDTKGRRILLLNQSRFFKQYHCRAWKVPALRTTAPITAKVTEKIAWKNGSRVAFGSKEYEGSVHWILLSLPGYTIYGESDDGVAEKPQGGMGLTLREAEELATLVVRNTPVTIQ